MTEFESRGLIRVDDLCELAGVKKAWLRRLEKSGKIPKQTPGGYPLLPALAAIFRHFRGAKTRLAELKDELENEAKLKEIELGELRGLYFDKAKVFAAVEAAGRAQTLLCQRALETELPAKVLGFNEAEMTAAGRRLMDQIGQHFADATKQWRAKPQPMLDTTNLKPGDATGGAVSG